MSSRVEADIVVLRDTDSDDEQKVATRGRLSLAPRPSTCSPSRTPKLRRSLRNRRLSAALSDFIVEDECKVTLGEAVSPELNSDRTLPIEVDDLRSYIAKGSKPVRGQYAVKLAIGPEEFVLMDAVEYLESLGFVELTKDSSESEDSLSYLIKEEIYEESLSNLSETSCDQSKNLRNLSDSEVDVENVDSSSLTESMTLRHFSTKELNQSTARRSVINRCNFTNRADIHNEAERQRRVELRTLFDYLLSCLNKCRPTQHGKQSKVTILKEARAVVSELKSAYTHLEGTQQKLARHNQKLVQKRLHLLDMMKKSDKRQRKL